MERALKMIVFALGLLFWTHTYSYGQANASKEYTVGQVVTYKYGETVNMPSGHTLTRAEGEENFDLFTGCFQLTTPSDKYMLYLLCEKGESNADGSVDMTIKDLVKLDCEAIINYSCFRETEDDTEYYNGIIVDGKLTAVYYRDHESSKFVRMDKVKCLTCCPDLDSEDYYYEERYKEYCIDTD